MWSHEGLREYVGGALWVWPSIALLRLLSSCAALIGDDPVRRSAIEKQVLLIVQDAERRISQREDFLPVLATAEAIGYPRPIAS